MVHQHRVGYAVAAEDTLQPLPHHLAAGRAGLLQRHQIAAVVVEHRERADGGIGSLLALEVHLPELVGRLTLEPSHGLPSTLPVQHQIVPQQHPMHGDHRQLDPVALQQHRQLACTPVRSLPAQLYDPRLDRLRRAAWTQPRTPAQLPHSSHSLFPEPLQPQIPGGPRDPELPAQTAQTLAPAGANHELHTLILHTHKPPGHPYLTRP